MAEEGTAGVDTATDAEDIKPDASGKYPDVPYSKYVGVKESLGKKLDAEKGKVANLEEQLKNAPNAEEHSRIKAELDATKAKLTEKETELTKIKEATASELRQTLLKRGVLPEERIKAMSEAEMKVALEVLGDKKPAPDMGSGGGSGELKGSPIELAAQAYSRTNK